MFKITYSVIYVAITVLPFVLNYFLKIKHKKRKDALKNEKTNFTTYESVFFNMKNFNCRQHVANKVECNYSCSVLKLRSLVDFISNARKSICICMYTITLKDIHFALIQAHEEGIEVRIITDRVMLKTDVSRFNFNRLQDKGIRYRVQPSEQTMMHHKFCLIDKESTDNACVLFGTMNLTMQALVSNFDNYIVTKNRNIIERYNEEFEELWESFHKLS